MSDLKPRRVILLVGSSADGLYLLGKALQQAKVNDYLYAMQTGREALEYLEERFQTGADRGRNKLGIVLLRGRLPDMEGLEVLKWIRSEKKTEDLKVYFLGVTDTQFRTANAAGLVADGYWRDPQRWEDYEVLAEKIRDWLA